jgi:predicted kinase
VRQAHLTLITGLPGTGKSTLARVLARHYGAPLICKDTIKEPLLDVIGATDRAGSRRLSDASFAVMFALVRDGLRAGTDLILEGNFRPGEHETALLAAISAVDLAATVFDVATYTSAAGKAGVAASAPTVGESPVAMDAFVDDPTDAVGNVLVTQVLCRATEPTRIARLRARATDPSRHAGHRDADLAVDISPPPVDFLALRGERFVFDSDGGPTQLQKLLDGMGRRR